MASSLKKARKNFKECQDELQELRRSFLGTQQNREALYLSPPFFIFAISDTFKRAISQGNQKRSSQLTQMWLFLSQHKPNEVKDNNSKLIEYFSDEALVDVFKSTLKQLAPPPHQHRKGPSEHQGG